MSGAYSTVLRSVQYALDGCACVDQSGPHCVSSSLVRFLVVVARFWSGLRCVVSGLVRLLLVDGRRPERPAPFRLQSSVLRLVVLCDVRSGPLCVASSPVRSWCVTLGCVIA